VCADADEVRWVCPGGGAKDELEGVWRVDGEARELGREVTECVRYRSKALAVLVYVQGAQLCGCKLDGRPFKRDRGLGNVTDLQAVCMTSIRDYKWNTYL